MKNIREKNMISAFLREKMNDHRFLMDTLIKSLNGMVYCCLPDANWTMIFISNGCKKLTGYEPEDLLFNKKLSYDQVTHPDDRNYVRESISTAIRNCSPYSIEYRIFRSDSNLCWVRESGMAIYDASGVVAAVEGFIEDISKIKNWEHELKNSEARYRSVFENAVEGIFQTSLTGQYFDANPALARIYGYESVEELMSDLVNIENQLYVDPNRRNEFKLLMEMNGVVQDFESEIYTKSGQIIWISENAHSVINDEGEILYYQGSVTDISERHRHEEQMKYQASHDQLTKLPNRYLLEDRLQQAIHFADRYQYKLAVAFLDLDHFKNINDSLGHEAGDKLLCVIADRLLALLRDSDTVVRLGGDEFVILLPSIQSYEYISCAFQRVLDSINETVVLNEKQFNITCSIGYTIYPEDGNQASMLLKNADTAMYESKQNGRNRFHRFTPKLNAILMQRMEIAQRLRNVIEQDELLLYYQPKVKLSDNKIIGTEALIRWMPERGNMISPGLFIPVAEETGMINEIGAWVLKSACRQANLFKETFGSAFLVSVNVSSHEFKNEYFVQQVAEIISTSGTDPQYIELEITESALADNMDLFIKKLHELKAIGVKLAIDDFGTGYSSLTYLKDFPVDRLKIDQGFVYNLEATPSNEAILKTIVSLGHDLGLIVIAEGVETAFQRDFLYQIGCDEIQGYLISQPIPIKDFVSLVQDHNRVIKSKSHSSLLK